MQPRNIFILINLLCFSVNAEYPKRASLLTQPETAEPIVNKSKQCVRRAAKKSVSFVTATKKSEILKYYWIG